MDVAARLIEDLEPVARAISLRPGEVLVREGDDADDVYYVRSGRLTASTATARGEIPVGVLEPGQIVGEVTVITGGQRTATLTADGSAVVFAVSRHDFEVWLGDHPDLADVVAAQARERIDRRQVAAMVSDLVGTADPAMVEQIVAGVVWRRLEAGDVLFRQGDPSDAAYFVVGGRLLVSMVEPAEPGAHGARGGHGEHGGHGEPDGPGERYVRELGRGQVVGELGLLERAPRSATVRAIRDTTLAEFSSQRFEELVSRQPALMLHVARDILTRFTHPPRRLIDRAAAIAVAVTAPLDATALVAGLGAEIARHGTVEHLSSRRVDAVLNRDGIAQALVDNAGVPRLAELMYEADVGNDHVLLEADAEATPWTRRALRIADRVVLVVSPDPDAAELRRIDELVSVLDGISHVSRMLAVVHPATADRPRGTARLLQRVGADHVVHLREGSAADIGRLARMASGHAVGLVLGGGGARGFAHLGVHRALLEAGVPIDLVGGSSIGAPIGGGIAQGLRGAELERVVVTQFHRLLDYTIPLVSLLKGGRISRNVETVFGTWDIEDLWLPYYCVSTNLTTARLHVHRRGDTGRAIRASVAIPGVLPPVPWDGDLLVDGGVLNNLPVEMMRQDGAVGTVIAVDVAPAIGPRAKGDYGLAVSGWRALGSSLRRRSRNQLYPSVASTLLRSMLTGAVRNQADSLRGGSVDLLVDLHLPGVALLDFERVREVAEAGYAAANAMVGDWAGRQSWIARPP